MSISHREGTPAPAGDRPHPAGGDVRAEKVPSGTKADLRRFNVTGRESDRHVFKVLSLRNVAVTPPYFHDGSAATLEEAVAVMAKYQLGRPLPPQDMADIVSFLGTLTGEFESKSL